jgi:hypothetical protein
MNKIILPAILGVCLCIACNNAEKKTVAEKTPADSLMHEVMEGHDAVMPKMSKVRGAQKKAQQMLDSLSALSSKASDAAAPLKVKLQQLINELNYADFAMDKWMNEFNMDSAVNDEALRIQYLSGEKIKINKVKDAVLNSLSSADSLFNGNR